MSLRRQLWIAIALLMLVALLGTLAFYFHSTREMLMQQLRVKNVDNVTALALSLTQLEKDPVLVELFISAQFDNGHYEFIRLIAPEGQQIVERVAQAGIDTVPRWFQQWVALEVPPGIAQIQDGWAQYGRLTLASHPGYAYTALWNLTWQLLAWFGGLLVLGGLAGTGMLHMILLPLGAVIAQAEAVSRRRFIQLPAPATLDFRRLVSAMNLLSSSVAKMLDTEGHRIEKWRQRAQSDAVTGAHGRETFLSLLDSRLADGETGCLLTLRLDNLPALNQQHGYPAVDDRLRLLVGRLSAELTQGENESLPLGRLGGAELAMLGTDGETLAAMTSQATGIAEHAFDDLGEGIRVLCGAVRFAPDSQRGQILQAMDRALSRSAETGQPVLESTMVSPPEQQSLEWWRRELVLSLEDQAVRLQRFPVLDAAGDILHDEAPVQMLIDGSWRQAGEVVPWIGRLGLSARLDNVLIQHALRQLSGHDSRLALQLSSASINDALCRDELHDALCGAPTEAARLCLELPEFGAAQNPAAFRHWCETIRPLVAAVGLKHAGYKLPVLSRLHDTGLSHIKLDGFFARNLENPETRLVVSNVCTMLHAIGVKVIAAGVDDPAWIESLLQAGVDGVSGRGCRPGS